MTIRQHDHKTHRVLQFGRLGNTSLGLPHAPRGTNTKLVDLLTKEVLKPLCELDSIFGQGVDGKRDEAQMGAIVRPYLETIRAGREKVVAAAQQQAADAEARRANLFAPPALQPGDSVRELRDKEIRDSWSRLSEPQRDAYRDAIKAGKRDDLLMAHARSPFATSDSEAARQLWEQRVRREQAPALAEIDAELEEAREWAIPTATGAEATATTGLQRAFMDMAMKAAAA